MTWRQWEWSRQNRDVARLAIQCDEINVGIMQNNDKTIGTTRNCLK